ncbi:hemerythrin domain-containing protein [Billgrantia bachuensis]|uniref:Hemerythrin domain-containing protein n=1 Tax=Billgrantia bachuensis TaxID=2717286 RepID=A0ABX0PR29_9GAMM|nr:hemerythrin domain-containing protein [Halomonas bachuensis]
MNALDLLKEDHDKVRELLEQLVNTTERAEKKRPELLARIEKEMQVHTQIEEEIFYPAFKEASGKANDKMYYEAHEEHRAVEDLVMPDLKQADPTGTQFSGRAKVLKELIEHHAEEEEEEMFPQARKTMSTRQLEELGEKMQLRKKELMAA